MKLDVTNISIMIECGEWRSSENHKEDKYSRLEVDNRRIGNIRTIAIIRLVRKRSVPLNVDLYEYIIWY